MEKTLDKIVDTLYTHLHENSIGDSAASVFGGALAANAVNLVNIKHMIDVAFYSFIGGIFGLLGKILIQSIIDIIFKNKKIDNEKSKRY